MTIRSWKGITLVALEKTEHNKTTSWLLNVGDSSYHKDYLWYIIWHAKIEIDFKYNSSRSLDCFINLGVLARCARAARFADQPVSNGFAVAIFLDS
jgi:hypothetical protein